MNEELVESIAKYLSANSTIFLQSDIKEVTEDMVQSFAQHRGFSPAIGYAIDALESNLSPLSLQTEREVSVISKNLPIYRMLLVRNDVEVV